MSSVSYTAYSTSVKTVSNLRHITAPLSALKIAISRQFISPNNPGSYDCGANFLGVLGEYENTQPIERGAALHCTWKGKVSDVLHWTTRPTNTPNVLYDFNGSCRMYQNNDPRFLLPYGSSGLILNAISIDNDEDLLRDWCYLRGGAYAWLYSRGWFRKRLLHAVKSEFAELNARCSSGEILISIHRGWPP